MENVSTLELQTNPQPTVPVEPNKTVQRLEKRVKILQFLTDHGIGVMLANLIPAAGLAVLDGYTNSALPMVMSGVLTLGAFISPSVLEEKLERSSQKLQNVKDKIQKKNDPKTYFNRILQREQEVLKKYERHIEGLFKRSDLDVILGIEKGYVRSRVLKLFDELSDEAQERLPEQKQKVAVLESAKSFVEKCEQKETLSKLIELANNPTKENLDLLQKIVGKVQTTKSTNTAQKSKSYEI